MRGSSFSKNKKIKKSDLNEFDQKNISVANRGPVNSASDSQRKFGCWDMLATPPLSVSAHRSGNRNAISIYNYSLNGWNGFRRPCRREAGRLSREGNQHVCALCCYGSDSWRRRSGLGAISPRAAPTLRLSLAIRLSVARSCLNVRCINRI